MDLSIYSDSALMSNKDCFHNINDLPQLTSSGTILVAGMTEATHFPNGFVAPGTLLARYTSGANTGYLAPYVHDHAGGLGLDTAAAMVWDGFYLQRNSNGVYASTRVAGSILLAGLPVQVFVDRLPGLLEDDGTTAHAPVAADLPTNFIAVDLGT